MALAFTSEPMSVILPALRRALAGEGNITFSVPDPDLGQGLYAGEPTAAGLHRPLSAWVDLADLLGAHLHTPEALGAGRIRLTLQRYAAGPAPDAAGYGTEGDWARVNKLEDPVFLATFVEALRRVNPVTGGRVLALGVNAGHELDALALAFADQYGPDRTFEVLGVDLDESALAAARARHPDFSFRVLDVNTLPLPELGTFDLVLALSLLQSPGVVPHDLLGAIRRHHLTPTGGLILGFPNARYLHGHLSYGARMKNYARPDLSLLCADVTQARRQLQKHGFKVFVTGKYEVLVTAIPAAIETPRGMEF